jgi:hypothetical protein
MCWNIYQRALSLSPSLTHSLTSIEQQYILFLLHFYSYFAAFFLFLSFFQYRYDWNSTMIGIFYSCAGFVVGFANAVLIKRIVPKHVCVRDMIVWGFACNSAFSFLVAFAPASWCLFTLLPLLAMSSMAVTCQRAQISVRASADDQGQLQASLNSIKVLMFLLGSLFFGGTLSLSETQSWLPIGAMSFFAGAIMIPATLSAARALARFPVESEWSKLIGDDEDFSDNLDSL